MNQYKFTTKTVKSKPALAAPIKESASQKNELTKLKATITSLARHVKRLQSQVDAMSDVVSRITKK